MCEYCGRRIHAFGCPEAEESEAVYACDYCKDEIFRGDRYIEISCRYFHEGCLFDYLSCLNEEDILNLFDLTVENA